MAERRSPPRKKESVKGPAPEEKKSSKAAPVAVKREKKPEEVPEGPERAGFALLLGKPNVGKSTLLNRLVGEQLAAVSPRPQTTRHRILGVVNRPKTQLCLVDVPGVHKAKSLINRAMVSQAMTSLNEVDIILYLAEAGWPEDPEVPFEEVDPVGAFHRELLADVAKANKPTLLILTKLDLLPKPLLLPVMDAWSKAFDFKEIYPLSALTGENVDGLIKVVREHLPEGEPLFSEDTLTDQTERALAAELIREQVFLQMRAEIPYGSAVVIELFDESERRFADEEREPGDTRPGLTRIEASIVVEREQHKGIVIGHRGQRLKEIGSAARVKLEKLLGGKVWLGLNVKVIEGWTEKRSMLGEMGLEVKSLR